MTLHAEIETEPTAVPRPPSARERAERIYRILRDRICLLEYPPGSLISEEGLAQEFEVSRTPVRRVLARLESEGLVQSVHGVGTLVTDPDIEELQQVYHLRLELALLIGKLTPTPWTREDIGRIRGLIARCDVDSSGSDQRAFLRLNLEFFNELNALTGNQPLREISDRLYHLTARIWLNSVPRLNLRDEIEIFRREIADVISALEIGDLESVGHIRRSHIAMSFARLQRYGAAAHPAAKD